jgi:positive regulator of sigma E activity
VKYVVGLFVLMFVAAGLAQLASMLVIDPLVGFAGIVVGAFVLLRRAARKHL